MQYKEYAIKIRIIQNKFFEKMMLPLQKANLTKIEFEILNRIFFLNKQTKATELAKDFQVSLPAILHKLDALEKKEFLTKIIKESDKRIKYYSLTDQANKTCEWLHLEYDKAMEAYFEALGEEKEHLFRILDLTIQFMEDTK